MAKAKGKYKGVEHKNLLMSFAAAPAKPKAKAMPAASRRKP